MEKKSKVEKFWKVVSAISLILFVWVFASFIDVNIHNGDMNYKYSSWNFFELASQMRTNK